MTPNKIEEQEPDQALEHKTPSEKVKTSWERASPPRTSWRHLSGEQRPGAALRLEQEGAPAPAPKKRCEKKMDRTSRKKITEPSERSENPPTHLGAQARQFNTKKKISNLNHNQIEQLS
jgi:hypothetical protein